MTVRKRKPRVMNSTKQPTSVLDMPETLALKIRAPARTAMQTPRYQYRRRPSSDHEADGEDQGQGEGDGGDVGLVAQADGTRALEAGLVAVAEDVELRLQEGHEG